MLMKFTVAYDNHDIRVEKGVKCYQIEPNFRKTSFYLSYQSLNTIYLKLKFGSNSKS